MLRKLKFMLNLIVYYESTHKKRQVVCCCNEIRRKWIGHLVKSKNKCYLTLAE